MTILLFVLGELGSILTTSRQSDDVRENVLRPVRTQCDPVQSKIACILVVSCSTSNFKYFAGSVKSIADQDMEKK